jgi:small neutral amino acid transporter SnatA (MarC family)
MKYFNFFNLVLIVVLCSFVVSYLFGNRSASTRNDIFGILIINAGYSVIIQGLRGHLKEWEERLEQSQAASAPIS